MRDTRPFSLVDITLAIAGYMKSRHRQFQGDCSLIIYVDCVDA